MFLGNAEYTELLLKNRRYSRNSIAVMGILDEDEQPDKTSEESLSSSGDEISVASRSLGTMTSCYSDDDAAQLILI